MPIYVYRCEECGYVHEAMQKTSDDALTLCSSCGKHGLKKQVTAAGFQLKGTGWYATDFRHNTNQTSAAADTEKSPTTSSTTEQDKTGAPTAPDTAAAA